MRETRVWGHGLRGAACLSAAVVVVEVTAPAAMVAASAEVVWRLGVAGVLATVAGVAVAVVGAVLGARLTTAVGVVMATSVLNATWQVTLVGTMWAVAWVAMSIPMSMLVVVVGALAETVACMTWLVTAAGTLVGCCGVASRTSTARWSAPVVQLWLSLWWDGLQPRGRVAMGPPLSQPRPPRPWHPRLERRLGRRPAGRAGALSVTSARGSIYLVTLSLGMCALCIETSGRTSAVHPSVRHRFLLSQTSVYMLAGFTMRSGLRCVSIVDTGFSTIPRCKDT